MPSPWGLEGLLSRGWVHCWVGEEAGAIGDTVLPNKDQALWGCTLGHGGRWESSLEVALGLQLGPLESSRGKACTVGEL